MDLLEYQGKQLFARHGIPVPTGRPATSVAEALRSLAAGFAGVIVTTGGTGFGPRDLTPEGTRAVFPTASAGKEGWGKVPSATLAHVDHANRCGRRTRLRDQHGTAVSRPRVHCRGGPACSGEHRAAERWPGADEPWLRL